MVPTQYLHKFTDGSAHDSVYDGAGYAEPWCALTASTGVVTYNKARRIAVSFSTLCDPSNYRAEQTLIYVRRDDSSYVTDFYLNGSGYDIDSLANDYGSVPCQYSVSVTTDSPVVTAEWFSDALSRSLPFTLVTTESDFGDLAVKETVSHSANPNMTYRFYDLGAGRQVDALTYAWDGVGMLEDIPWAFIEPTGLDRGFSAPSSVPSVRAVDDYNVGSVSLLPVLVEESGWSVDLGENLGGGYSMSYQGDSGSCLVNGWPRGSLASADLSGGGFDVVETVMMSNGAVNYSSHIGATYMEDGSGASLTGRVITAGGSAVGTIGSNGGWLSKTGGEYDYFNHEK